jgi:hypothetical protein
MKSGIKSERTGREMKSGKAAALRERRWRLRVMKMIGGTKREKNLRNIFEGGGFLGGI